MLNKDILTSTVKKSYPEQILEIQAESPIDIYINNQFIVSVPANTNYSGIYFRLYDEIWIHSQQDALLFAGAQILIERGSLEMISGTSGRDIRFRFIQKSPTNLFALTFTLL